MARSQIAGFEHQVAVPSTTMSTKSQIEGKRTENITPERQRLLQQDPQAPKRETTVSVKMPTQDEEKRRRSVSSLLGPQKGIYWRSPVAMILAFLLGLGSALALHGYYSSLDGKKVGDSFQQQNALRIGTALAFITQISLVGSVHFAYVQCLWRALKRSVISVRGVDAGFDVTSSLLSFTNLEMLSKLRLASFLALIVWCIPIASLITPATLNINSVMQVGSQMVNVSTLQIAQAAPYFNFAYDPYQGQVSQKVVVYSGPRSILSRLAVATAATGQILSLPAPFINATYQQNFYGPYVQCQTANDTIANQVDMATERAEMALDPSIREVSNEYFAFVPALVNLSGSSFDSGVQVANLSNVNGALNASNQLWMKFPRYPPDVTILNVTDKADPYYLSCELYNASYEVNFSWVNGIQSISMQEPEVVGVVPYPTTGSSVTAYQESSAYSAFMWALSNQLVGSMGFYQSTSNNGTGNSILNGIYADNNQPSSGNKTTDPIFSEIYTNIDQTSLLGSSDFNSYFIKNHALHGHTDGLLSPQRLQDMAYARNRTLDVLIPELSSNITLSLIIDPLLAPSIMTNVTTTTPENIYSYHPFDVLLSYALAICFALLANILGIFAYIANNASHENSFSSIVCTTFGIHISGLKAHEKLGELPLDPKVARRKLQWCMRDNAGGEGYGFHLAE